MKVVEDMATTRLRAEEASATLSSEGAEGLYRRLLIQVRDIWRFAGSNVRVDNGVRRPATRAKPPPKIPVREFWDGDLRGARDRWARLRRRRHISDEAFAAALAARKDYDCMVTAKEARFRELSASVWRDDSDLNHTGVWKRFSEIRGKGGASCQRSAADQSSHFAGVTFAQDTPDAAMRLADARRWLGECLESGAGLRTWHLSGEQVQDAYDSLKVAAPSLDGMSKSRIAPFLALILLWAVPLFQVLALSCATVSIWRLSVLVSIIKKGGSRIDMNNFRGIHVLQFFRQWFAACCLPELSRVASIVVSPLQQGFMKGRKMWVAYLALYALIESGRCSERTVFVTFIDVKKAFPSVCREILWRELFDLGVDPRVLLCFYCIFHYFASVCLEERVQFFLR